MFIYIVTTFAVAGRPTEEESEESSSGEVEIEQEVPSDPEDPRELHPGALLHRASRLHNLPLMAEALAHGADVHAASEDEEGKTPLIQAVMGVSQPRCCTNTQPAIHGHIVIALPSIAHVQKLLHIPQKKILKGLSVSVSGLFNSLWVPATERSRCEPEGHERQRPPASCHRSGTHRVRNMEGMSGSNAWNSSVWGSWGSNQTSKSSEHLFAASYSLWHLFLNNCIFPCVLTEFTNSNLPDSGVSLTSVSADVQSGVSVPEERSIADWGGRAGSRPPEHRSPSCQRRHRHPVSHLHSSQTSSCLKFPNFQTV